MEIVARVLGMDYDAQQELPEAAIGQTQHRAALWHLIGKRTGIKPNATCPSNFTRNPNLLIQVLTNKHNARRGLQPDKHDHLPPPLFRQLSKSDPLDANNEEPKEAEEKIQKIRAWLYTEEEEVEDSAKIVVTSKMDFPQVVEMCREVFCISPNNSKCLI